MLRGLELQHNCNITATRTATQPRNAVIYRVNLPCSMFKGFEPLRKRPCLGKVKNADCVVKKQRCVAVLQFVVAVMLQSCCSKSPRNTVKKKWQLCPTKVAAASFVAATRRRGAAEKKVLEAMRVAAVLGPCCSGSPGSTTCLKLLQK